MAASIFLVSEESGSEFIEFGDVVGDGEDVSLASGVGRLHADDAGLLRVVGSEGIFVGGLLVAEIGCGGVSLGRHLGLGLLQLGLEIGLFLGALGHESLELLVGVDGSLLGGLDGLPM